MKTVLRIFESGLWLIGLFILTWPAFGLTMGHFSAEDGGLFWSSLVGTIINVVIFYGNALYLMPRQLAKRKRKQYVLSLVIAFVLLTLLEITFDYLLLQTLGRPVAWYNGELIGMVLVFNFFFLFLSLGYGFFLIWLRDTQYQKELEREKLASELNFLRSQINPHFLFNTLNNLFAMSRKNGDYTTAEQLARLAGIMRYMLYETNADRVSLRKEMEYLQNYIELQQLRFQESDPITINCTWPEDDESLRIAPFLLIPFVENAFQYGISLSKPSAIALNCKVENGHLLFTLQNTIHKVNSKEVGGIGLQNATQRLKLIYPEKHQLEISTEENWYRVQLKVDCKN
ncbi:histidine kinase [Roseivirga sp. UBA838]|uniref:sensor histidine kinase n=1 Tax=Roseivirga sp. UBA838 TaxID=1947393 RepID=UPI00257C9D6D|nr:histidine kinase [Roseivirga sp. UBA838]|tara:strand:- start:31793 stop:32821 length:1029 start_codon:yes stop_codon:yes gene_type:complete